MTDLELYRIVKHKFKYEDGKLFWKNPSKYKPELINKEAGSLHKSGYRNIKINNKSYREHRIIFLYFNKYLPKCLDHIDRNKSNNKIENLREATKQQNSFNSNINKNNTSGFKGVDFHKPSNKWRARIHLNNKLTHLGMFSNPILAAYAYDKVALINFKEFAKLNFPCIRRK